MTFAVVGIFEEKDSYNFRFYLNDEQASGMWDEQLKKFQWHTESTTKYSPSADDIYHTCFLAYDRSDAATEAVTNLYVNRNTYGEDDTTFAEGLSIVARYIRELKEDQMVFFSDV